MRKPFYPGFVFLFIVGCMSLLAVLCYVFPQGATLGNLPLRWPSLHDIFYGKLSVQLTETDVCYLDEDEAEAFDINLSFLQPLDTLTVADSVTLAGDTVPTDSLAQSVRKPIFIMPEVQTQLTDNDYFPNLRQALRGADTTQVRILHYGDSQIEEDRITGYLRRRLQEFYGGNGSGLIPLVQTIPTLTLHQTLYRGDHELTAKEMPTRYMIYGSNKFRMQHGDLYGPMGHVAMLDEELRLELAPATAQRYSDMYMPVIRLFAEPGVTMSANGVAMDDEGCVYFSPNTRSAKLTISGQGAVYGLSLESKTGVVMDNIPMRGSRGDSFTLINAEQLARFYARTNTRLIIMQYGGNALPGATEQYVQHVVKQLRRQIQFLHACAPWADILFIGPSDMIAKIDGVEQTDPNVVRMDDGLRRMAELEHIGYFSLYQAMGGQNAMLYWRQQGWAGPDGVHFTRAGAEKMAALIWEWLAPQLETKEEQNGLD